MMGLRKINMNILFGDIIRKIARRFRMFANALNRNKIPENAGNINNIDVLVVSPGGVGTTFLMNHLSSYVKINSPSDVDGLKHAPIPYKEILDSGVKVIYMYGDPEDVYRSIKKRGWIVQQGVKLGSALCVMSFGVLQKWAFIRSVNKQKMNWISSKGIDVLQLSYEDIWSNVQTISYFLNISDPSFVTDFPERKKRTSKS